MRTYYLHGLYQMLYMHYPSYFSENLYEPGDTVTPILQKIKLA